MSSTQVHKRTTRERSWFERAIILFFYFHPHFAHQHLGETSDVFGVNTKTIYHWIHKEDIIHKWKHIVLRLTARMVLDALPKRREIYATRFTEAQLAQGLSEDILPSSSVPADTKTILFPIGQKNSHQKQRKFAEASKNDYVYLKKQQKRVHTTKTRTIKFAREETWLIHQIRHAEEQRITLTKSDLRAMVRRQFTHGTLYECHIRDPQNPNGIKDAKGFNQWLRRTLQHANYIPKKESKMV